MADEQHVDNTDEPDDTQVEAPEPDEVHDDEHAVETDADATDADDVTPEAEADPAADESDADAGVAAEPAEAPARAERLHLKYVAHSEIGPVRKNNQDSGYASPTMLVVADGMGGAAAGDLASSIAIEFARRADREVAGEDMLEVLAGAVARANSEIADLVVEDRMLDGMGTTLTGAMFDGHQLGVVHIGDSRAYRMRDGQLELLTHDHSWVQALIDEGKLTPEEAAHHPHRSLILKVINGQENNTPDTALVDVQAGDRLLFCSDGLCGMIEDPEIERGMQIPDLDEAMDKLVAGAHREGGMDNITVLLADVIADPAHATTAPKPVGAVLDNDLDALSQRRAQARAQAAAEPTTAADVDDSDSTEDDEESDPESERYAPRLAPRRRWWIPVVSILGVLIVLGAVLGGGYAWSRTQYFVAPAEERVAIYQGLPQDVLGRPLSEVYEVQPTQIDDLPPFFAQQVRDTIVSSSLEDARATTRELQAQAEQCIEARQGSEQPSSTPTPGASPSPAPTDETC